MSKDAIIHEKIKENVGAKVKKVEATENLGTTGRRKRNNSDSNIPVLFPLKFGVAKLCCAELNYTTIVYSSSHLMLMANSNTRVLSYLAV